MKQLTPKAIRLLVKQHATISEITSRYGISEEELFQMIQKFFSLHSQHTEANRIWSKLQKNSNKKAVPKEPSSDIATEHNEQEHTTLNLSSEAEPSDSTSLQLEEDAKSSVSILSQLEDKAAGMSYELMQLELNHKECTQKLLESRKRLSQLNEALEQMKMVVKEYEETISGILEEVQLTCSERAEINAMRREMSANLSLLRAKIFDLKKVTIFVYEDGTIDVENGEVPAVNSETLNQKFGELVLQPQALEFSVTLKEINSIATLLLWTEHFESSSIPYEVVFDRDPVRDFYNMVKA